MIIKHRLPSFRLRLDQFQLGPVVGKGTVGTIYQAIRKETDEPVAIKLLLPTLADDELVCARFEREMTVLEELSHPNIIRYHGGGKSEGQLFFVMEIVEGGSVRSLLQQQGPFSWQETATLGCQLASALQHAHNHGVIHRDIKPSNLLLTRSGELKLSDFGIAHDANAADLTDAGLTVGSHLYMSPEQITGNRRISGQTDLYSMGCVLHEMLTGEAPFHGEHFAELFERHLHEPPPTVLTACADCPSEFAELIQRLLAKRAGERPFNARAVQGELIDIAQSDGRSKEVQSKPYAQQGGTEQHEVAPRMDGTRSDVSASQVFSEASARIARRIESHRHENSQETSWLKIALLVSWIFIAVLIGWLVFR